MSQTTSQPISQLSILTELSSDAELASPTHVAALARSWYVRPSSFWYGFLVGGITVLVSQQIARAVRITTA